MLHVGVVDDSEDFIHALDVFYTGVEFGVDEKYAVKGIRMLVYIFGHIITFQI